MKIGGEFYPAESGENYPAIGTYVLNSPGSQVFLMFHLRNLGWYCDLLHCFQILFQLSFILLIASIISLISASFIVIDDGSVMTSLNTFSVIGKSPSLYLNLFL
jgi:hypothetical protein